MKVAAVAAGALWSSACPCVCVWSCAWLWLCVCVCPVWCYWEGAVLQLFEWPYDDIAAECPTLAKDGWKAVQLSPVHSHRSLLPVEGIPSATGEAISYPWWERYQPMSYNLTSRSGDVAALRRTVEECADVGIQVIADIVLNNLAAFRCCDTAAVGSGSGEQQTAACSREQKAYNPDIRACAPLLSYPDLNLTENDFHECSVDYIPPSDIDPVKIKDCSLLGLPDLRTASPKVQSLQRRAIRELLHLGISGFRVDAAKHMWDEDLEELFGLDDCTSNAPVVRADIVARTGAGVAFPPCTDKARPRLLLEVSDPRPKAGLRYSDYSRLGHVTFFDWSERITGLMLCFRSRLTQGQDPSECPPLKYLPQYLSPPAMLPFSGRANFLPYESALLFVTNHDNERLQFMPRPPIICKWRDREVVPILETDTLADAYAVRPNRTHTSAGGTTAIGGNVAALGHKTVATTGLNRIRLGIGFSEPPSTKLAKMALRQPANALSGGGVSKVEEHWEEPYTPLDSCELDALTSYNHPNLWALANVFTLAMPYGTPRVLSSYEWSRQYIRLADGRVEETRGWVGPPRTGKGGTRRVLCFDYDRLDTAGGSLNWHSIRSRLRHWDTTPSLSDDGLHFNCEHRLPMIGNMAGWREKLKDYVALEHTNRYIPAHPRHRRPDIEKNLLSFGRGNDRFPWNRGWLVINFGQEPATDYTFETQLPPGVYCDLALARWRGSLGCGKPYALVYVDVQGRIKDMTVREESAVILHTSAAYLSTSVISKTGVMLLLCFHVLIPVVILLVAHCRKKAPVIVVSGEGAVKSCDERAARPASMPPVTRHSVFLSGIEHHIPEKGVSVNAGGLGKVIGIMTQHHPGNIVFAFPSAGGVDYGSGWQPDAHCPMVNVSVEGRVLAVMIWRYERRQREKERRTDIALEIDAASDSDATAADAPSTTTPSRDSSTLQPDRPHVVYLRCEHPILSAMCRRGAVYPSGLSSRGALTFFSMWNQCVGALLQVSRLLCRAASLSLCVCVCVQVYIRGAAAEAGAAHTEVAEVAEVPPPDSELCDVFHCPDYHSGLAPLYCRPFGRVPCMAVLHNGEYQGEIFQQVDDKALEKLEAIFALPRKTIHTFAVHDGRFNMLSAMVRYCRRYQGGIGVSAVSAPYAHELWTTMPLLRTLAKVDAIPNPVPESERPVWTADDRQQPQPSRVRLMALKARNKELAQKDLGLVVNRRAKIWVFVGRWVHQKGIDLIADVARWMLLTFPYTQLVCIGPVGDAYGEYARRKLESLKASGAFEGRLYVAARFMRPPPSLQWATDFCIMPSRSEPFGYVDVEFAWRGSVAVASLVGGLGKVPGFYFPVRDQTGEAVEDADIRAGLQASIRRAMLASDSELSRMAEEALATSFPLYPWQHRLAALYKSAVRAHRYHSADTTPRPLDDDAPVPIPIPMPHTSSAPALLSPSPRQPQDPHRPPQQDSTTADDAPPGLDNLDLDERVFAEGVTDELLIQHLEQVQPSPSPSPAESTTQAPTDEAATIEHLDGEGDIESGAGDMAGTTLPDEAAERPSSVSGLPWPLGVLRWFRQNWPRTHSKGGDDHRHVCVEGSSPSVMTKKQVTMASVVKQAHALYQFGLSSGGGPQPQHHPDRERAVDEHAGTEHDSSYSRMRQWLVHIMAWQGLGGEVAIRNWLILLGYCLAPASGHIIFALAVSALQHTFPPPPLTPTPPAAAPSPTYTAFFRNGWLPCVLFSVWALCYGVSSLGWAVASRRIQVNKLFCTGMVAQAISLLAVAATATGIHLLHTSSDTTSGASPPCLLLVCLAVVSTVHSVFAATGFPIFLGFNFMDMPEGSLSCATGRTAVGESVRHLISYALLDVIIFAALTGSPTPPSAFTDVGPMPVVPPGQSHTQDVMDLLQGKLPPGWKHVAHKSNNTGNKTAAHALGSPDVLSGASRKVLLNFTRAVADAADLASSTTTLREDGGIPSSPSPPAMSSNRGGLAPSSVVVLSSVGVMCVLLFLVGLALLLGLPPVIGETKLPSVEWPFDVPLLCSKRRHKASQPPAATPKAGHPSSATCFWTIAAADCINSLSSFPSVLWLAWLLMLATSTPMPQEPGTSTESASSHHHQQMALHSLLRRLATDDMGEPGTADASGGEGASTVGVVLGVTGVLAAVVSMAIFGLISRMRQKSLWPVTGLALLVPPPAILRALGMHLAATGGDRGSYVCALVVVVGTLLLDNVKMSAAGVLKIQLLKSRWRVVVWGSVALAIGGVCEAVSPYLSAMSACAIGLATNGPAQLPFDANKGTMQPFYPHGVCGWDAAGRGLVVRSLTALTDPQMLAAAAFWATPGPACVAYVVQLVAWRCVMRWERSQNRRV